MGYCVGYAWLHTTVWYGCRCARHKCSLKRQRSKGDVRGTGQLFSEIPIYRIMTEKLSEDYNTGFWSESIKRGFMWLHRGNSRKRVFSAAPSLQVIRLYRMELMMATSAQRTQAG